MAFPTVAGISENQDAVETTNHPVTIPVELEPGSVLILIEFSSHNENLQGHPPGFELLHSNPGFGSGNINIVVRGFLYLPALLPILGVERPRPVIPGGTMELITTNPRLGCVYAIAFAEKNIPLSYFRFAGTGGGAGLDPPNLVYSAAAKDVLWWALGVGGGFDFAGHPTNYTLYQNDGTVAASPTFGGISDCAVSARELNAASEDPGAFSGTGPTSERQQSTMGIALDGP